MQQTANNPRDDQAEARSAELVITKPKPIEEVYGLADIPAGVIVIDHARVTIVPHHIATIGPRVYVLISKENGQVMACGTPDQLRHLADRLKLAAGEAEDLSRQALQEDARHV